MYFSTAVRSSYLESNWEEVGAELDGSGTQLLMSRLIQGHDGQGIPCCMLKGKEKGLSSSLGLGHSTSPAQNLGFRMFFKNIQDDI